MTYYDILEVKNDASTYVIEKAYRRLAAKYQPELHPPKQRAWAKKKLKELQEAYDVFIDNDRRKQYDALWKHHPTMEENLDPFATKITDAEHLTTDTKTRKTPQASNKAASYPIWKKLLVWMIDVVGFFAAATYLMVTAAPVYPAFVRFSYTLESFFACWFIWIFIEAYILASFGTTFGRKLVGITVKDAEGQKPGYAKNIANRAILLTILLCLTFGSSRLHEYILAHYKNFNLQNIASLIPALKKASQDYANTGNIDIADKYMKDKLYDIAIFTYEKELGSKPNDPVLYHKLGKAYAANKDFAEAIKSCQRAAELYQSKCYPAKTIGDCYYDMAYAYFGKGDNKRAIYWAAEALANGTYNVKSSEIYTLLAACYRKSEPEKAYEYYQKAANMGDRTAQQALEKF